uniref:Uncharacterized protein n=1 Tax=Solanum lycopersicum TaxID=4081 RepID=A0A3Q7IXI9_SOLLC
MILQASISSIKCDTRMLICNQLDKTQRLISEKMWLVHHVIAMDVFKKNREEHLDEAWSNTIFQPEFKKKVIFIMGATGMGKSRLSVDLATHF